MTEKKDDDKGRKDTDVDDTGNDDDDNDDDDDDSGDDEQGWDRLGGLVRSVVKEELSSWSGPQEKKTKTSSRSPRKAVPQKPARKKGFLSGQFFSGLDPEE